MGELKYSQGFFAIRRSCPTCGGSGKRITRICHQCGGERYTLGDSSEMVAVPAVAGSMMMVRREIFRSLGGFDERYFMYMEDTDLSRRMIDAGYVNLFVPSAGAVHHWGKGSTTGMVRRKWRHHKSVLKYFHKYHHGFVSWVIMPVLLLANFLAVIVLPERRKEAA